jgi:uncharacterized SAM-binding protein YcdF (DUF218 family)
VADHVVELFGRGLFPRIVFTGANAPTTAARFPRGEAVHYREHAISRGVPDDVILVEPNAKHTVENIVLTKEVLAQQHISPAAVMLVSKPYQQRRAYTICRKHWPEVDVVCASLPLTLDDYVTAIGDHELVVTMLVGDTQRLWVYADRGWAIPQAIPGAVCLAFQRLVDAGFTGRLL